MTTDERELTEPVDLCTPDGDRLNPEARGWSRRPLHRANLEGHLGSNKRWDYWAVLAGDLVVSAVCSNIDHFGLADVWWADLASGTTGGRAILLASDQVTLPERPGTAPLRATQDGFDLTIVDDDRGTRLASTWTEPDGRAGVLDKHTKVGADDGFGSETHQVFGTFAGRVRTDDGLELTFDGLQGFAEEARQRW